MKLLMVTDIHGDVEKLERVMHREDDFDVALCAGDISDSSKFSDYGGKLSQVLDVFDRKGKMTKMVPGNMDQEQDCVKELIERRMNIHKKIASFQEFDVVGFGGGITPFGTPFEPEESEIYSTLNTLYDRMGNDRKFAVLHQPPHGCVDVTKGSHVGSEKVKDLLNERDFELVLTGHIHEGRGVDTCAGTRVVNPGPLYDGNYAVAEVGEEVEVSLKSL